MPTLTKSLAIQVSMADVVISAALAARASRIALVSCRFASVASLAKHGGPVIVMAGAAPTDGHAIIGAAASGPTSRCSIWSARARFSMVLTDCSGPKITSDPVCHLLRRY